MKRSTVTGNFWMSKKSARARIGTCNENKTRRIRETHARARDGDFVVFKGLAQKFQNISLKLRHLIQKQHSVVGQTHLTRLGILPAADQSARRDGMMRM